MHMRAAASLSYCTLIVVAFACDVLLVVVINIIINVNVTFNP